MYDEIRRPRVQTVFNANYEAGKVYDKWGKSGPSTEGMRQDLANLWGFMKDYNFDKEVERALAILSERRVFS